MPIRFNLLLRVLHWSMAILILAMLCIGVGMVSTAVPAYATLLALHRPVGLLILLLVVVRLAIRLMTGAPKLPADMPAAMRLGAEGSHVLLYAAMFAMPLIGWAMLSAGGYPVMLGGSLRLPPILPEDALAFAWLRSAHGVLAYLLFFTFLTHMGAALYHGLIRRDSVLRSMLGTRC
jgi:cytochrome b561